MRRILAVSDASAESVNNSQHRYENDEAIPRRRTLPALGWLLLLAITCAITLVAVIGRAKTLEIGADDIQEVRTGKFEQRVLASGHIVPLRVTVVPSVVAGRVQSTNVHPGDTVEAGAELLLLENPDLAISALEAERLAMRASEDAIKNEAQARLQVSEAQHHVVEGRGELRVAEQAMAAAEYLLPHRLIAPMEVTHAQDQLAAAHALLRSDSMALQFAMSDLARLIKRTPNEQRLTEGLSLRHREQVSALTVRAPAAGVLQEFDVTPGEWLNPGQTVARIMLGDGLGARLDVYEADAALLAPGESVLVTLQTDTVRGKIERIAPAARDGRVLVEVKLEPNPGAPLRPEQAVTAEIIVKQVQDVEVLPRPSWVGAPGLFEMLCVDRTRQTAEVCRIDVTAVSSTMITVSPWEKGLLVVVAGQGPPFSASHYRLR